MTKSKSQKQLIKNELIKRGSVNNARAFSGGYGRIIFRLGAIIHKLRWEDKMNIETIYKNVKGQRNTYYKLK